MSNGKLRVNFALRVAVLVAGCAMTVSMVAAQQRREREPNEVYAARRAKIAAQVDGPVILWGFTGREEFSQSYIFAQEDNFYYLTGHNQEGAGLIILPAQNDGQHDGVGRAARDAVFAGKGTAERKMERYPDVADRCGHFQADRIWLGRAIRRNASGGGKTGEGVSDQLLHDSAV